MRVNAKIDWHRIAALVAACTLACVCAADEGEVTPEQYKPQWKIGQKWVVETVSRQMQVRRAPIAERTGKPLRWQFEVLAMDKIDERECFRVRVKCLAPGQHPETTLWVDRLTMALRQVQTQLPVPGGFHTVTETYRSSSGQPFPAFAPITVPPLELPVFLSGMKGTQTFSYEASSGPGGVKAVGEIGFAFNVQQHVTRPKLEDVQHLLPEDYTKGLAKKQTIEVRLTAASSNVRQLWQPGLPWPVYSNNRISQSRLITAVESSEETSPTESEPPNLKSAPTSND